MNTIAVPAATTTVRPATVEVQVVRIGPKQMTKAVWNQLSQHWLDANGHVSAKSNGITTRQGIDLLPDPLFAKAASFEDILA